MQTNDPGTAQIETMATVAVFDTAAHYILRLYIIGNTSQSTRAVSNIRKICEQHLEGRYKLEVVDISLNPALARGEQIIAAPTLIKVNPLPLRRFIGDMSQTARILLGFDLANAAAAALAKAS